MRKKETTEAIGTPAVSGYERFLALLQEEISQPAFERVPTAKDWDDLALNRPSAFWQSAWESVKHRLEVDPIETRIAAELAAASAPVELPSEGNVEDAPVDGKYATGRLDGGCEIRISVTPRHAGTPPGHPQPFVMARTSP